MIQRLLPYFLLVCIVGIVVAVIFPPPHSSLHNARRASCQSNLKQIGMALQQYAQDYELPPRRWKAPLLTYVKDEHIFQCPETSETMGANDYFFNSRFLGTQMTEVFDPETLILVGDGKDDTADATLFSLPAVWRTDRYSPAWRHLDTANYLFADGHVKGLKVNHVNRDFRVVNR